MSEEFTPDNSFVCEECSELKFDGAMCVLSCTQWYEGLICIDCAERYYKDQLRKAIAKRDKEERR